jgi:hypothetical protein
VVLVDLEVVVEETVVDEVVVESAVDVVDVATLLVVGEDVVLEVTVVVTWLGVGRPYANQIPSIPWPLVSPGLLSPL